MVLPMLVVTFSQKIYLICKTQPKFRKKRFSGTHNGVKRLDSRNVSLWWPIINFANTRLRFVCRCTLIGSLSCIATVFNQSIGNHSHLAVSTHNILHILCVAPFSSTTTYQLQNEHELTATDSCDCRPICLYILYAMFNEHF